MSDNFSMNQLKANVKNHYENDSIIQLAMGIFKFNTYLDLDNRKKEINSPKKRGVINILVFPIISIDFSKDISSKYNT